MTGPTPTCAVCGREVTDDWFNPPTFSLGPDGRPVLSKPIRHDPDTGAICWCRDDATGAALEAQ